MRVSYRWNPDSRGRPRLCCLFPLYLALSLRTSSKRHSRGKGSAKLGKELLPVRSTVVMMAPFVWTLLGSRLI